MSDLSLQIDPKRTLLSRPPIAIYEHTANLFDLDTPACAE
jgi:hypothetical protein